MKTALTTFAIMLVMLIMTGCTKGPSNADAEAQIKESIKSKVFDVVSVHVIETKEDATLKNVYDTQYEAEVTFKVSYAELLKAVEHSNIFNGGLEASMKLSSLKDQYGEFKSGETKKIKDVAAFEKSEKGGWSIIKL